ncbi:hypothetical protein LCGC14_0550340 [marine sediment metagenome]|uniref:HNH nuclease domain-containing protein n=1 Tax=marine sediment metagenome TaxID=412755 RepID=A0A0F9RQ20_9ZZZZ
MKFKICSSCETKFPATVEFFHKNSGTKDGLYAWCKKCCKKYAAVNYKNNKEQILEQERSYYKRNRNKILKRKKKCNWSEERKAKRKRWEQSDEGEVVQKRYGQSDKGKEVHKKSSKKYYENNKLSRNISVMINWSLKGNKNNRHWEYVVGYLLNQLKKHLESLFEPGMSWDNYGKWHIDHKIPISAFNITSYNCEDFKSCWALGNLQPLWARDNLRKGNKLNYNEK